MTDEITFNGLMSSLMQKLGYPQVESGVCEGAIKMAIQSFYTDPKLLSFRLYLYRLDYLFSLLKNKPVDEIAERMLQARERFKNMPPGVPANPEDQAWLDVWALCDGIQIHLNPDIYGKLFNSNVNQGETEKLFPITRSRMLDASPPIVKHSAWVNFYELNEFTYYLRQLEKMAKEYGKPLAFDIYSHDHTIGLFYDPLSNLWTLLDVTNFEEPGVRDLTFDAPQLAKKIFNFLEGLESEVSTPTGVTHRVDKDSESDSDFDLELDNELAIVFNVYQIQNAEDADQLNKLITRYNIKPSVDELMMKKNSLTTEGITIGYLAAVNGDLETINVLIDAKADFSYQKTDGVGIISAATLGNHSNILEALRKTNAIANVDEQDDSGMSPLHWAAKYNYVDCIEVLCDLGANVELMDSRKMTPLRFAVAAESIQSVNKLLEHGATVSLSILESAIKRKNGFELFKLLLPNIVLTATEKINLRTLARECQKFDISDLLVHAKQHTHSSNSKMFKSTVVERKASIGKTKGSKSKDSKKSPSSFHPYNREGNGK